MRGLNMGHYERGSSMPLPFPSAGLDTPTCLLCSPGASCGNGHCSLEEISRSISEPWWLRYSEGIAVTALKQLKSEMVLSINQRNKNHSEANKDQWQRYGLVRQIYEVGLNSESMEWEIGDPSRAGSSTQSNSVLAKICRPWIWKKSKTLTFEQTQHDFANDFQGL
jgi:hypothetical protein